jgi:hypothetical protein
VKSDGAALQFGAIDRLEPGEIASWHIRAKATKAGRVRFELQMTTGSSQRPIGETEPTTLY